MRLFIGNIPFKATEEDLQDLISPYGTATRVQIATDRETGKPRGFGFADVDDRIAESVITGLNGADMGGRQLNVNEARPPQRRSGGGGGGEDRPRGRQSRGDRRENWR